MNQFDTIKPASNIASGLRWCEYITAAIVEMIQIKPVRNTPEMQAMTRSLPMQSATEVLSRRHAQQEYDDQRQEARQTHSTSLAHLRGICRHAQKQSVSSSASARLHRGSCQFSAVRHRWTLRNQADRLVQSSKSAPEKQAACPVATYGIPEKTVAAQRQQTPSTAMAATPRVPKPSSHRKSNHVCGHTHIELPCSIDRLQRVAEIRRYRPSSSTGTGFLAARRGPSPCKPGACSTDTRNATIQ